ncbi:ferritin-like domain-containing protein [Hymenobacter sp. YC55]|uniref:ferritin-like domain-containing protein n=1 Tax=Hymenobacter sp. YC55 TaxID=3034019 RepID=UPI0023F659E8|nr:ferritin-like domain-containing protein [Hymenobacter sp. YC55]MDF7810065.1 ferritin-like domain-containing protein [Hymenobacter sp. YC55]
MDLFKLIKEIEQVDPEIYDRLDSRRRVFKHFGMAGKAVTAAVLPGLVSGLFQRAYGQGTALPADIVAVLNLALSLEYLEFYFYDSGLKAPNLIPTADRPAFEKIRNDESGHIKILKQTLGSLAIAEPARSAFDYSGGRNPTPLVGDTAVGNGPFRTVFTAYPIFLGVSQSFVDTGIRAYKGGAPVLMPNKDVLEAALNIHSVEARHSSHVRTIRRGITNVANPTAPMNAQPKSWVSLQDNGGPSPDTNPSTRPVYGAGNPASSSDPLALVFPAEDNVTHLGVAIPGNATAASEAFDEPLDPTSVKNIARNFVVVTSGLFPA